MNTRVPPTNFQPLVDIPAGQILASGVFIGMDSLEAPLWADGRNVEFRDGTLKKALGWRNPAFNEGTFDSHAGLFDSASGDFDDGGSSATFATGITATIRGLAQQLTSAGAYRIFFGTATNLYVSTGGTASSVGSGYGGSVHAGVGTRATMWSMVDWGDWMLATNGVDTPQVYKGSSFADLGGISGIFDLAQVFVKLGPHLVAINTDGVGANGYEWSAAGNPEQWDPDTYVTAGNKVIREMEGEAIAAVPLGAGIAVYSESNQFLINYVNSPFFLGDKPGAQGIGAVSKHSVVSTGAMNYGFGPNFSVYETDGRSYRRIDTPAMRQWLERNLNVSQQSKVNGYRDHVNQRIVWFIPSPGSEPDVGIGFSPVDRTWTMYGYGRTVAVEKRAFAGPLAADENGNVFEHNFEVNAGTAALEAWVQSKPFDAGDPNAWKYLDTFRMAVKDLVGSPQFQLGFKEDIEDSFEWSTPWTLQSGFEHNFVDRESVFFAVRIYSNAVDEDFTISRLQFNGSLTGPAL